MAEDKTAERPGDDELLRLSRIADRAVDGFQGNATELEGAIGMLFLARRFGWKVVMLVHDRKTVRKYEKILGINVREHFPAVGDRAHKSLAYVAVQKVSNFWKAVRGEVPKVKTPQIG